MTTALGFLFALLLLTYLSTRYINNQPHSDVPVMSSQIAPMEMKAGAMFRSDKPDLVSDGQAMHENELVNV